MCFLNKLICLVHQRGQSGTKGRGGSRGHRAPGGSLGAAAGGLCGAAADQAGPRHQRKKKVLRVLKDVENDVFKAAKLYQFLVVSL